MYKIFTSFFIAGLCLSVFVMPKSILAAELTFKVVSNTKADKNTAVVEVRVNPESKKLNVIEGTINFENDAENDLAVQVENGHSVLPLWPIPPLYIEGEKAIHFAGGIPDGFDKESVLFILNISSHREGLVNVSYREGNAYLNDGKGTKEAISSKPLSIDLGKPENNSFNGVIIISFLALTAILVFRHRHKKNVKN